MILSTAKLCKSFGSTEIIKNASLLINEKEKAALVGLNGAGKTTLLRILSGEESADSGTLTLAKGARLAYLQQINRIDSPRSILEELYTVVQPLLDMEARLHRLSEEMKYVEGEELEKLYESYDSLSRQFEAAEGYRVHSKVQGILYGLGFSKDDFDKNIQTLSGGQKTRVFLAKILLEEPDIILLDEPTNHLDLFSIEWLEGYLSNYKGAVLIVSHDRYFLDKIVTKVFDLDGGELHTYIGNYSDFIRKKEPLRLACLREYENQQNEIRHQEAVIEKLKSFNREKSIKRAESREKMLEKIERIEKPDEKKADMQLYFEPAFPSGKDVLDVEQLGKAFGEHVLFKHLSFSLKRGERVAIIGENGSGKTSILKILNGLLTPDEGSVCFGSNVLIAYYDQEHHILHEDKTLFAEISDAYPDLSHTRIRSVLAAFLFMGDDVFKKISSLSGGERGRLSLAKLMLGKANLLILDEPTNHLDMLSKEILEHALRHFEGTVLYVSHDRYFINRTATRILHLNHQTFIDYIGNYDYYLEKREHLENILLTKDKETYEKENIPSSAKQTWQANKEEQARLKKQKRQLEKCEESIAALEERLAQIEEAFSDPEIQRNLPELIKLQKEKEENEAKLEKLMTEWEVLASLEE